MDRSTHTTAIDATTANVIRTFLRKSFIFRLQKMHIVYACKITHCNHCMRFDFCRLIIYCYFIIICCDKVY